MSHHPDTMRFSRRVMLALAAALGICAVAPRRDGGSLLLAALSDTGAAARLAQAQGWQRMGSRDALVQQILGELDLPGAPQIDVGEIRRHLARRIGADFAEGRTLTAGGWLLTITEARLCAIAAHDLKAGA